MKKKKGKDYIDFGQWLYELRAKKGITEDELAYMIGNENITEKNIRKWERDLEFPNLDEIYKLSEIYEVASQEIIDIKNKTLEGGVNAIHKQAIRWISFFLGLSIYSTIILNHIIIYGTLILVWVWFFFMARLAGAL